MGKQISVNIDGKTIVIDSDTPNFDEFVSMVVNKKDYDFNLMTVICEGEEKFDSESFKQALIDVVNSVIDELTIDKTKLNEKIKKIEELKKSNSN